MKINSQICLILLFLVSCSKQSELTRVLELSGNNRQELEQVLTHYQQLGDMEKLQAAEFLISNMIYGKYSYQGDLIARYDTIVTVYDSLRNAGVTSGDPAIVQNIWKQLGEQYGQISTSQLKSVQDYNLLSSTFLIQNIDSAFAAWKRSPLYHPEQLSLFYEYILPHRIMHEPAEQFRAYYYQKYKVLADTAKDIKSLIHHFHEQLFWGDGYRTSALLWNYPLEFSMEQMERGRRGSCRQLSPWMTLILRSLGYPATIDRAVWANRSQGHLWNVLLLSDSTFYPFNTLEDTIQFAYKPAKILRKTYSLDRSLLPKLSDSDLPPGLIQLDERDVTHEYVPAYDISVSVEHPDPLFSHKKHAVICVFDNQSWRIVHWGSIKSGKMYFNKMAADVAYIAAYYDHGEIVPATEPFLLHQDGRVEFCNANPDSLITLTLARKYPRFKRIEDFAWGMRRANAEGSNHAQFVQKTIFFSIYDPPFHIADSLVNDRGKYRYVRLNSATHRNANFAEVEFYGKVNPDAEEEKLTGTIIGYPPVGDNDEHSYIHAMDEDLESYFSKPKNTVGWVGLDLGKGNERIITRVRMSPRSDTNFILKGDVYALQYWHAGSWQNFETKRAEQYNTIQFEHVPGSALYLLKNLSRGKEERIFTYEDGKQIWW